MSDSNATTSGPGKTSDPGKLARSATGIPIVPVLDGFRGIAVMAIVMLHLIPASGMLSRLPDGAVMDVLLGLLPRMMDVLFIVSGFVLFMPTLAKRGHFGDVVGYAVRRAARILPTYYLVIVVVTGLLIAFPSMGLPVPTPLELALHIPLLQSPAKLADPSFPIGLGLDGALWTISALAMFYVLLPLIARPYYRHPLIGLAIAGLITVLWREWFDQGVFADSNAAAAQFPYWTWHLGLGMTAAWAYFRIHERGLVATMRRWVPYVQLAALAGIVLVLLQRPLPFEGNLLAAIAAASESLPVAIIFPALITVLMLATAEAPRWARAGLDSAPARRLGDASYGIYMIHLPIALSIARLGLLPQPGTGWRVIAEFLYIIPPSILFGWLAFQYIERPIRLRARAWAYRRERFRPEPAPPGDGIPTGEAPAARAPGLI